MFTEPLHVHMSRWTSMSCPRPGTGEMSMASTLSVPPATSTSHSTVAHAGPMAALALWQVWPTPQLITLDSGCRSGYLFMMCPWERICLYWSWSYKNEAVCCACGLFTLFHKWVWQLLKIMNYLILFCQIASTSSGKGCGHLPTCLSRMCSTALMRAPVMEETMLGCSSMPMNTAFQMRLATTTKQLTRVGIGHWHCLAFQGV